MACFGADEAPRTRAEFERKVERGRERVYPSLEANDRRWPRAGSRRRARYACSCPMRATARFEDSAAETRAHLQQLLNAAVLQTAPPDWLRQLPRYLKAEQRRWQRNAVRGSEPAPILRELRRWSTRLQDLDKQLDAELRFIPQLDELRFWIEEYRVSLYAQELKTLGPISAARLEQRAAEIDAWLPQTSH